MNGPTLPALHAASSVSRPLATEILLTLVGILGLPLPEVVELILIRGFHLLLSSQLVTGIRVLVILLLLLLRIPGVAADPIRSGKYGGYRTQTADILLSMI